MYSVTLDGKCSIDNIQELRSRLLEAFDRADDGLEIDVSGIDELDTAGIQLFVSSIKEAAARKIRVRLKGPLPGTVRNWFRLSGVHYEESGTSGV